MPPVWLIASLLSPAYAHLLSLFFLLFYFSCSYFKSLSDQLGNNEISLSSGSQRWPLCGLFGAWLPPSRKNRLLTSLYGVTQDVISPVNGSLNRCPATGDLEKESLFVGVLVISTALACLTCRCQACLVLVKPGWGHHRMLLEMSRGLAFGRNAISTALASVFSLQTLSTSIFVQEWPNLVSSLIHENYGMRTVLGRQRKMPVEPAWHRNDTCMFRRGVYMWRHIHVVAHMWWSEDTIRTWFSPSALLRQGSSCFCDVCKRLVNPHHLESSLSRPIVL